MTPTSSRYFRSERTVFSSGRGRPAGISVKQQSISSTIVRPSPLNACKSSDSRSLSDSFRDLARNRNNSIGSVES
ncbi:hypothetical protein D3C71_1730200 [compost metagenome]